MRSILVLNSKGGTGKTTLATNLAAYYALEELALVDYDVQRSALDWLERRKTIHGVDGTQPSPHGCSWTHPPRATGKRWCGC